MFDDPEYRYLKGEADYLAGCTSRMQKYHKIRVPNRDVKVGWPPRENYRPASFLSKTATREQVTELEALLEELWSLNQRFAGEPIYEVYAYLTVTGEHLELEHGLLTWCDGYMRRRADPSRVNSQVDNCPFLLSEQLVKEWYSIFGKCVGEGSVSSMALTAPLSYTRWLLFDRLWKHLVVLTDEIHAQVPSITDPKRLRLMEARMQEGNWLASRLPAFFREVKAWVPAHRLAEANRLSNDVLRARIAGLARDFNEMRPFLVHNFHPHKTLTQLTADFFLAWDWRIGTEIAGLVSGKTEAYVYKAIERVASLWSIHVGYDGLLFEDPMVWYTALDLASIDGTKPLALNYLILEHFRDLLYSFYEKIDFKRLRHAPIKQAPEPADTADEKPGDPTDSSEVNADEAVAVACHRLAESPEPSADDADADSDAVRRLPVLRLQRVLRLFETRLACEVGQGKGSEVNIYRPGGRIFTLGAHKRNREVHPLTVRRMLKALDIPVADFRAAVFGRG